jgi:hypothetical protein
MRMKKYYVTIYGRTDTIFTGIRNEKLYSEIVISNNKDNAKAEALNDFYMFINDTWGKVLDRRDIKVECDLVSWLKHDDRETIYMNAMLK